MSYMYMQGLSRAGVYVHVQCHVHKNLKEYMYIIAIRDYSCVTVGAPVWPISLLYMPPVGNLCAHAAMALYRSHGYDIRDIVHVP